MIPYDLVLKALVCGLHFIATDESGNELPQDCYFITIYAKGIKLVLKGISGFEEIVDYEIVLKALSFGNSLNDNLIKKFLTYSGLVLYSFNLIIRLDPLNENKEVY